MARRPVRRTRTRTGTRRGAKLPVLAILSGALLLALALRSFVFAPFLIPSASMMPALFPGDLVLVAKWPYGFSRHSVPGNLSWPEGRLWASSPARGDIVVFRASAAPKRDYVKRVLGVGGESVAMRRGTLIVEGNAVPRTRIADLLAEGDEACRGVPDGPEGTCRYARFRETLADGRSHATLDVDPAAPDAFPTFRIPPGQLLLLGDNRDRSADSRLLVAQGGIGLVDEDRLIGRPVLVLFSSDGSARWSDPASWLAAVRWDRIGLSL